LSFFIAAVYIYAV